MRLDLNRTQLSLYIVASILGNRDFHERNKKVTKHVKWSKTGGRKKQLRDEGSPYSVSFINRSGLVIRMVRWLAGWLAGWLVGLARWLVGQWGAWWMSLRTGWWGSAPAHAARDVQDARRDMCHVRKHCAAQRVACAMFVFSTSLSLSLSHAAFSMPFCLVLSSSCILLQLSEYSSNISVKLNKIPSLLSPGGWPFFSLWISHHNWNYILKFPFYRFIILVLSLFCFFPFKISILFCFNLSQVLFSIYVIHWWHDWIVIR